MLISLLGDPANLIVLRGEMSPLTSVTMMESVPLSTAAARRPLRDRGDRLRLQRRELAFRKRQPQLINLLLYTLVLRWLPRSRPSHQRRGSLMRSA